MILEVRALRSLIKSNERHEGCEALVKPEIVPPLHCHEIAKPHVSELVKVCAGKSQSLCERRDLTSHKIVFVVSNQAYVFHGTEVVLWDEDLVILVERILCTEED